jgi:hypothetical protein
MPNAGGDGATILGNNGAVPVRACARLRGDSTAAVTALVDSTGAHAQSDGKSTILTTAAASQTAPVTTERPAAP